MILRNATTAESAAATCRHCGADLRGAGLPGTDAAADARFCCEGCRVVHGILSGDGDGVYYDLMAQSGAKAPRAGLSPAYREYLAGLRDPEALRRIGRWEGGTHGVTLECSDMQCAACGWLMERVLGETEGVVDYDVDFVHGEMHVRYDAGKTLLPDVLEGIGRYGYAFRPKTDYGAAARRPALDRDAWMRLAVAAACFLNAMAFSLGPYVGFGSGMDPRWVRILGLWSFAASLPAVFYAAFPFYRGAWRALRARAFTIDVTITIGIALAFVVSLASVTTGASAAAGPGHFNYSDTLTGLIFFLLAGRYAVRRFEGGLALRGRWHEALSPAAVRVVDREGVSRWVPLAEAAAGDTIEIAAGEYLPVDGHAGADGAADTAFLTGEERPRPFAAGDFLFAGYRVLGRALRVRVVNPHQKTRAAALGRALEALAARKRERGARRERVALWFTLAVAAAALATLLVHWSSGWEKALLAAASVFIVSCSCALALAVPVSRGVGLLRAHRLGFHFRSQETLERLAEIRAVVFDKTGTLTFTRRSLEGWDWADSFDADPAARETVLRAAARLAGMSAHPVATAVHAGLDRAGEPGETVTGFAEIPHFGLLGRWRGAGTERELVLCRYGAWDRDPEAFRAAGLEAPPDTAGTAENPPQSCLFVDGRIAAFIRLGEDVKPGVSSLLAGLGRTGVATLLLSGDHPDRVADFAARCGFAAYKGGLSPEEKQEEAARFQEHHGPVLAVGDGYNDSLLFGEAATSLAVQGAAGPVAAEADAFMTTPRPESILTLLRVARGTRRSLRNCYVVSAVYNGAAITLAMAGLVSPLLAAVLMPAASLSLFLTAWLTVPSR